MGLKTTESLRLQCPWMVVAYSNLRLDDHDGSGSVDLEEHLAVVLKGST